MSNHAHTYMYSPRVHQVCWKVSMLATNCETHIAGTDASMRFVFLVCVQLMICSETMSSRRFVHAVMLAAARELCFLQATQC